MSQVFNTPLFFQYVSSFVVYVFQSSHSASVPSQVDLGFIRLVSAIGTQGAISQETNKSYYVKSYKVEVSSNGEDWIMLKEDSKHKVGPSSP